MTCVFQFKPLAKTCSRSRTSGLTATTSGRPEIVFASSIVSVGALPQPPRMPPLVKLPEKTVTTLSPRLATWSSTCLVAPLVRLTEPMTAPTPMMMPSMVSNERILLRRNARKAILNEANILILRQFYRLLRLPELLQFIAGNQAVADLLIRDNCPVAQHDHPLRIAGDIQ